MNLLNETRKNIGFIAVRLLAIVLLFWALGNHPYGYYTLLRFVVCGVTAYGTCFAIAIKKNGWAWILGIIAVLFNPVIPVHMNKSIWAVVDVGVALVLLTSLFFLRGSRSGNVHGEQKPRQTDEIQG